MFLNLHFVVIVASGGPQVKQEGLVMLQPAFLLLSLRLSLVVQQQVWVVVAAAVGHHHSADSAGVDVLDLEETLDDVDVLRFHIL